MTRRRIAAVGRLSMAVGSLLMVGGLSIRGGALGVVAGGGPSPSVVPSPTVIALAATPSPAESVRASLAPKSAAPATPSQAAPVITVFEDSFEFEGAWPTGELGDLVAAYEAGTYVLAGPEADLPVFIAPVAEQLASASIVVVEAELTLEPGAQAGVYVGGSDSERFGALIGSDGRVTIIRDSSVSLDVIGSGSVAMDGPAVLTLTVDGSTISVAIDGQQAVSVATTGMALEYGLIAWPTRESAASVARFRVVASISG
jgi:hypothetical protein